MECCMPRPEYPRPQFVRDSWLNLNGAWEFAFDHGDTGEARGLHLENAPFPLTIQVPFCPESSLSGVEYKDFMSAVWYRRTISLTEEQCAGRVFIRFGAVDYRCTVYVNGKKVDTHVGGYSSFGMEITGLVNPGHNILVVQAQDNPRSNRQPVGKQSRKFFSHACDYTRTTGIWQTVWLEFTPKTYIDSVRITPDDLNRRVSFAAKIDGCTKDTVVKAVITKDGRHVGGACARPTPGLTNFIAEVSEAELWEPGKPVLYDVTFTLERNGEAVDTVHSYFGFRRIEIQGNRFLINGKPVFQRTVLDQGFYPDGIYTAPTDEALKHDIELSMAVGFNGARLHQKVFEERFLYWADRLGYLVWGEHASWGLDITGAEGLACFLPEWMEIIKRDVNHPAIIGWCPFNETSHTQDKRVLATVWQATKDYDPTRPCIDTSGYCHVVTDVYDDHDYDQNPETFRARYQDLHSYGASRFNREYFPYHGIPFFLSEFGGTWWAPGREDGWGYGNLPKSEEEVICRMEGLFAALLDHPEICGYCYTQLTDIEQEQNGIYTYNREKKFSDENYARIRAAQIRKAAYEEE